ncbi:MAG: ABC transporter permease, partial [Crenarchaeota archaeon]|nr:ABC transporter permease [Thermoproteota archaeon]
MGAKRIIEVSLRIAWKDLKELERNKLGLLMLILMPLLMMAMIGYIYPSGAQIDMSNLKVQVVNLDTGYMNIDASETFASAVNQINSMSVNMQFSNGTTIDALTDSIQRGDTDAGIIIPSNFTQCILNNQQANITIISDNSNPQVSTQVSSVLTGIIESMSKQITQSNLVAQLNITPQEAASYMAPYTVNDQGVVGESSSYFQFIAPGMMMMTVMMSVMTGLPGAITMERELGTLDGVMVAPINRLSIILG